MDFDDKDKSMLAPIIPVHLPAAFVKMCIARGFSAEAVLEQTGISLADLESLDTRFNLKQNAHIVSNALRLTKDPSLSIAFSQHIRLSHLGAIGIAFMSAPTLRDVLALCHQYWGLLDPTVEFKTVLSKTQVTIYFGKRIPLGLNYYYTQETICLSIIRILGDLIEREIPQLRIYLDYAKPSYAEKFQFLNAPIYWKQKDCKLVFHADILDMRLPGADYPAFQRAIKMCDAELSIQTELNNNWLMKVKLIILKNLHAPLTAEEIAEHLHLSRRTFFRKLAEHQCTYDSLLSASRAEVARDYLLHKKVSLGELADQLGYNDVSNFTKAFKRWYGMPPKQWCQSQLKL